jgi:hypothetical protein
MAHATYTCGSSAYSLCATPLREPYSLCATPCHHTHLHTHRHIPFVASRSDLRYTAPRAWPPFPFLTEEEIQQVTETHPSAPLLKAISDYDVKLVQRLLYYTRQELWLSDSDKEWHYPLLIYLREKDRKNWRNRSIEAWEARWEKGAQQEERQRQNRTVSGIAFTVGFQS